MTTEDTLTEKDVAVLLEGMRSRGELKFKTEDEFREALTLLDREEIVDLLVMWRGRYMKDILDRSLN